MLPTGSSSLIVTDPNMAYGTNRGTFTCEAKTSHVSNVAGLSPVLSMRNPAATDDDRSSDGYENDDYEYVN